MTNNKRFTRRAFGRRALAFGVAMFAMVTLTAVGFAAWLISTDSNASGEGSVVTQTVTQANIKITIQNVNGEGKLVDGDQNVYDIIFAPTADAKGLITFDGTNGDKPESLKFSFNGTIENYERVGELNFSVKVPDSILKAAGLTKTGESWTYSADDAYISLPSFVMDKDGNAVPLVVNGSWDSSAMTAPISFSNISDLQDAGLTSGVVTLTKPQEGSSTASFKGTDVTFGWGARYGSENPATTINSENWTAVSATGIEKDMAYTTNQIQLELIKLQAVVNDIDLSNYYTDCGITLSGTIEEYVKGKNTTAIQTQLAALQQKVSEAIASRPQYTLYIEALVRS